MNQLITVDAIDQDQAIAWADGLSIEMENDDPQSLTHFVRPPDLPEVKANDPTAGLPATVEHLLATRRAMLQDQGPTVVIATSLTVAAARAHNALKSADPHAERAWQEVVMPMAIALSHGLPWAIAIALQNDPPMSIEEGEALNMVDAFTRDATVPGTTVIRIPVTPGESPPPTIIRDLATLIRTILKGKQAAA